MRAGSQTALILLLGACTALGIQSCGGGSDCSDGVDNDGDGFVDSADPGCPVNGDVEAPDPPSSACGDAVDNDGDGKIDGEDPGCDDPIDNDEYNVPIASCRDGIDNDGDGKVDFPNDPGCLVSLDDDEADPCPSGPTCSACGNGRDDDGDGAADYPEDLGCDSASDRDEFNADPSICGANVALQPLPDDGLVSGFLDPEDSNELISFDCGGSGAESVYIIDVDQPIALVASTDFPETELDTVLYLRTACRDSEAELSCNDDEGDGVGSTLSVAHLDPGEYYLVVDSRVSGVGGAFKLQVDRYLAEGVPCNPSDLSLECAPGYLCRLATADASGETCELPQCADQSDYDGDGKNGFPDDPGCDDVEDNDESDNCPDGPNCPACGNGVDDADPEDSLADYPDDPGCSAANDPSELDCTDSDPLVVITEPTTTGDTTGATHDSGSTCDLSPSMAPEIAHQLQVPGDLVSLSIDTNGTYSGSGSTFDTVLYVKYGDCTSANLACHDGVFDSNIQLNDVQAGSYYIFVGGWNTSDVGPYTLHVSGVIKAGQPCDPAQVASGLFSCEGGGTCTGGTCQ